MNSDDVLARILPALDAAGIPYMLTGSFASVYYGPPRATQDIDLVIAPTAAQLRKLIRSLPAAEYYVNLDTALEAFDRRSQFNLIDFETGWKIDFIIRKDRPFSLSEFDRRTDAQIGTRTLPVATAEDIILAKLEWAKAGGSLRQIEDVTGILKARDDLDRTYIEHWVAELGIPDQWREALVAAGLT